jgi:hypothetical protein
VPGYVEADVKAAIDDPITFQDFNESLNAIYNKGAPGHLVPLMLLQLWPKNGHLKQDGLCMIICLTSGSTACLQNGSKHRVIKLAPKIAGNSELKNMRTISLYEFVQKVWITIVFKQIHLVWQNHEVLHSSQYGYRLDNGTLMALLNVVNEIEGAIYNKETKTSHSGISVEPLTQFQGTLRSWHGLDLEYCITWLSDLAVLIMEFFSPIYFSISSKQETEDCG